MFKTKWRIVADSWLGYGVQKKVWWFPFWYQPRVNTFSTLDRAIERLKAFKNESLYQE